MSLNALLHLIEVQLGGEGAGGNLTELSVAAVGRPGGDSVDASGVAPTLRATLLTMAVTGRSSPSGHARARRAAQLGAV